MSSKELKDKIKQVIDNVPEALLPDILNYLNDFQNKSQDKISLYHNLMIILKEDNDLLQKLAQ
jgi:hypothetical protein